MFTSRGRGAFDGSDGKSDSDEAPEAGALPPRPAFTNVNVDLFVVGLPVTDEELFVGLDADDEAHAVLDVPDRTVCTADDGADALGRVFVAACSTLSQTLLLGKRAVVRPGPDDLMTNTRDPEVEALEGIDIGVRDGNCDLSTRKSFHVCNKLVLRISDSNRSTRPVTILPTMSRL